MRNFNLHTTLNLHPSYHAPELPTITRGASAELTFDLSGKAYTMDYIEQFTYILKQGNSVMAFEMVEYFTPSEDVIAQPGKVYYEENTAQQNSVYRRFKRYTAQVGDALPD